MLCTGAAARWINADPGREFIRKHKMAGLARLMMDRSRLFALAVAAFSCLLTAPASAANAPGRVEFEVLRGGQPFGRQGVTVTERDGQLAAETSATLRAGLGPVTFFSYSQRCNETWRSGALIGLRCLTRQNGRSKNVEGQLSNGALRMNGTAGAISFDPRTLPTSWWTRPPLTISEMINSETGGRLPVHVTLIGRETIVAGGQRIAADHIRVQGAAAVDLWYDDAGHWVSCAFTMQGQHMTYRLLTRPSAGPS
jgi:hypothetical protein